MLLKIYLYQRLVSVFLAEEGRREGAYAVKDIANEKVLLLFEQEDDASRYCMLLEDNEDVGMEIVEVDEEVAIKACEVKILSYLDGYSSSKIIEKLKI